MGAHEWVEGQIAEIKAENAKRNIVLRHWDRHFKGVKCNPTEFYQRLATRLEERGVPEMMTGPIFLKQAGPMSPRRMYLRMQRERLVFEICGLPFADGMFFSERVFDRRRPAGILEFLIVMVFGFGLFMGVWFFLPFLWAFVITTGAFALLWSLMRLGALDAVGSLDRILSDLPVIGPIHELLFHPDTYHRQDTMNAYQEVVRDVLMSVIDEITKEQGIRPMTEEERRPYLRSPTMQRRW